MLNQCFLFPARSTPLASHCIKLEKKRKKCICIAPSRCPEKSNIKLKRTQRSAELFKPPSIFPQASTTPLLFRGSTHFHQNFPLMKTNPRRCSSYTVTWDPEASTTNKRFYKGKLLRLVSQYPRASSHQNLHQDLPSNSKISCIITFHALAMLP